MAGSSQTLLLSAFNNNTSGNVEILVVAGGGGGGYTSCPSTGSSWCYASSGGGGAGGLISGNIEYTVGNNIVTVGAGGTDGSNSVFGPYTAIGGGSGFPGISNGYCTPLDSTFGDGGSGGGGGYGIYQPWGPCKTYGNGIAGQGFRGGIAEDEWLASGGGGGATERGYNANETSVRNAGPGGNGFLSNISGTSTYYAGGGGGGKSSDPFGGQAGSGGNGGGGNGAILCNPGQNGFVNTGGGGGGAGAGIFCWFVNASTGGSGIVIIKYPDSNPAAVTTGSPTVTVTGGSRIYKFTGSGTMEFI